MKKLTLLFPFVMIICLVFSVSCVSKQVEVTETYYETKYRTETYTEVGEEQRDYLTPKWTRYAFVYFTNLEWAKAGAESYFDGYEISTAKLSKSQARLILSNLSQGPPWGIQVINLTGVGKLPLPPPRDPLQEKTVYEKEVRKITTAPEFQEWFDNLNAIVTDPKHFISFTRSDEHTGRDIIVDVTGVEEFMVWTCVPMLMSPIIEKVQLIWSEEVTKERQVPYQVEKQRTVTTTEKVPIWEAIFGK
jgi:hypothetical protein